MYCRWGAVGLKLFDNVCVGPGSGVASGRVFCCGQHLVTSFQIHNDKYDICSSIQSDLPTCNMEHKGYMES